MKRRAITMVGKVSENGSPLISNKEEMNHFFKSWIGLGFTMTIEVYPKGGSDLMKGYYFKKVVPDFQRIYYNTDGERLTLAVTDLKLRKQSFVMQEEIPSEDAGGFDLVRVKTVYEVSSSELSEHIEFCRQMASIEYSTHIEEPKR